METPKHFLQIPNTETMKMEEKLWKSKGRAINMYIGKENKNQAY